MEEAKMIKILICDDDPEFCKLVRTYLRSASEREFVLLEARRKVEIQDALDKGGIDLILMDILMPEKSGMEWLEEIVKKKIAPVVMLTGFGSEEIAVQALHKGAIDYIPKDHLTGDRILGTIKAALEAWKRKQMEAEIKKEKEFSENLIETAGVVIVGIDLDDNTILCNTKTEEVTGYSKEELIGKNWLKLVYPVATRREEVSKVLKSCLDSAQVKAYDAVITRKDGGERILSWDTTTLKEAYGETRGILCIAQDITDRKQLEQELKENRDYLESLIQESPTAILSTDLSGNVIVVNKSVEKLLGYKGDALMGKPLSMVISEQGDLEIADKKDFPLDFVKEDGSKIPLNVSTSVQQFKGEQRGLIVTLKDLSELKGLFITPVSEVVVETEMKYRLEPGSMYLVEEEKPEKSFDVFVDSVKHGRQGLYISRQNPAIVREKYQLEKTPDIWLTRNKIPEESCIGPDELVKLYKTIENFVGQADDGVILFEAVEYLVIQNGFQPVLKFIQSLNDVIMVHPSRLIVVVDPLTMDVREMHILKRDMKTIP